MQRDPPRVPDTGREYQRPEEDPALPPRVSILLPAFDAAATLETCLRSVLRQRETDFECWIVDDGSRDATARIAQEFARADPRFRVASLPHRGLIAALEAGLALCTAPIVARMDADDWMHRARLGAQLEALAAHPEWAAVGCHVRGFPRTRTQQGRRAYESWLCSLRSAEQVRADAFVECPIAHPSLMIRKPVLERFGYRDRGWPEDYDLILRLLCDGHEIGVVPRQLVGWRDHPTRLSRRDERYGLDRFTACKAEHLATSLLADNQDYILWGHGDTGRALSRALLKHQRRAVLIVELHPGRIGQRIHGAPVIHPDGLADAPALPIVASVAGASARLQIRECLRKLGKREGSDYVCAA